MVSSLREYCFTAVMGIEEHGFRTQAQCLKLPLVESPSERNHLIIYQYYKKESVSHFLSNYIPNLSTRKQQSMNILGNTWIYRMRPLTFSRSLKKGRALEMWGYKILFVYLAVQTWMEMVMKSHMTMWIGKIHSICNH